MLTLAAASLPEIAGMQHTCWPVHLDKPLAGSLAALYNMNTANAAGSYAHKYVTVSFAYAVRLQKTPPLTDKAKSALTGLKCRVTIECNQTALDRQK